MVDDPGTFTASIPTPFLLIDEAIAGQNIRRIQDYADRNGICRPAPCQDAQISPPDPHATGRRRHWRGRGQGRGRPRSWPPSTT